MFLKKEISREVDGGEIKMPKIRARIRITLSCDFKDSTVEEVRTFLKRRFILPATFEAGSYEELEVFEHEGGSFGEQLFAKCESCGKICNSTTITVANDPDDKNNCIGAKLCDDCNIISTCKCGEEWDGQYCDGNDRCQSCGRRGCWTHEKAIKSKNIIDKY